MTGEGSAGIWRRALSAEQDAAGERPCRYRSGLTFTDLTTGQRTALARVLKPAIHEGGRR